MQSVELDTGVEHREARSFLMPRNPSVDRRFRPRPKRQVCLFDHGSVPEEDDYSSSDEDLANDEITVDESVKSTSIGEDGALIYLRLRPVAQPSPTYAISETGNVLITGPSSEASTNNKNNKRMEKHYSFSAIFDTDVKQPNVYEMCVKSKIEADESSTVLTYGTSGSGKTYTLLGDDSNPGIIPRYLEHIFKLYDGKIYPMPSLKLVNGAVTIMTDAALAKETRLSSTILNMAGGSVTDLQGNNYARLQQIVTEDHQFEVGNLPNVSVLIWISFLEIYNEIVVDLLAPLPTANSTFSSSSSSSSSLTNMSLPSASRKSLKIVGNDGKVFVKGLTSVYVTSSLQALKLLRYGLQRVSYAATSINSNSSRSHCIFFVDVLKYSATGEVTETSYKFCDLAGSERLHKTGNMGSRLKEAQRINTSLMVLGRCLDAAHANRRRGPEMIPYRESKLTMLLQAALLGKEKLTMIVNVTPLDKYYEENLNVLNFSSIAKNIIYKQPVIKQNRSRYSFVMNCSKTTSAAQNEYVEKLLQENISLRSEVDRYQTEWLNIRKQLQKDIADLHQQHSVEKLRLEQDVRNQLVDEFQQTLQERKKQHEARMQQELNSQQRNFEVQMAVLKRRYEDEIEDLKEELEDLKEKENSIPDASKKRRTLE